MNDIVGFVHIRKNATTCKGAEQPEEFMGQICLVVEFDREGGILCLNPQNTALAMFDKEDILRSFKCGYASGIVTPPDLDTVGQIMYVTKAQLRKGGYNGLLANMVIQASLATGKFHDSFLWVKQ